MSARDAFARLVAMKDLCADLERAGYRILAPGEVDKVTVERCVAIADAEVAKHNTGSGFDSQPAYSATWGIAAALRSLGGRE